MYDSYWILESYLGFKRGFVPTIGAVDEPGRRGRSDAEAYLVIDDRCVERKALNVRECHGCNLGTGYWDGIAPIEDRIGCRMCLEIERSDYADAVCISSYNNPECEFWPVTCPLHHGEPVDISVRLV